MRLFVAFFILLSIPFVQAEDSPTANCNDSRRIYKICSDQGKIFKQASAEALSKDQFVVVVFGADWCPWCHSLNKLFAKEEFMKKSADAFTVVEIGVYQPESVDTVPSGIAVLEDLLIKNKVDASVFSGVPLLAVVDPATKKTVFIQTGDLEDNSNGEGHDATKVLNALNEAMATL